MENLGKKLMLGGSMAAMVAAISAAQAQPQTPSEEQITSSASRLQIQGYEAPTPVTVIGIEQLNRDAKIDIGDSIREMPSVGISDSPGNGSHSGNASQGDAGLDTVNLRNLGVVRTLVLFDRQRVVTSNPNSDNAPAIGGVDLSTLPSNIIERVDIVTGGASAQWGSDAVAGVVNLVINKRFTGLRGNISYGNSQHQDRETMKAEVSAGFDWFGDRAHTVLAGTYTMAPNAFFGWNRDWFQSQRALIPCSQIGATGGSSLCHTPIGLGSANQTNGGLIGASPVGTASTVAAIAAKGGVFATAGSGGLAAANALRGIQFIGTGNIQTAPFNYGTLFNNNNSCFNCSGFNTYGGSSNIGNPPLNAVPYHNLTLFHYTSFKLTDSITASIQLNYGKNNEQNTSNNGRAGNNTIQVDNAYLPTSIRDAMIAGGIPSLTVGVANAGNMRSGDVSIKNFEQAVSINVIKNNRELRRGVFTLDGVLQLFGGEDWSWEGYIQHSSVRETQQAPYNTFNVNYGNATDAVLVQSTGPNSLGGGVAATATAVRNALTAAGAHVPVPGEIACRSALTATEWGTTTNAFGFQQIKPGGLMAGCEPLNILGTGNASQAALNYVAPGRTNRAVMDQALYRLNQTVASLSASGTLPFGLPAGKIAMATGFEYRHEQQRNRRDPLQLGATGVFQSGNFSEFGGQYHVEEGFLEFSIPVLRNNFVDSFDITAAGRITSYSFSGMVQTWKLGAVTQVNSDIKLRASYSNDIRAPGIGELFSAPLISTQTNQVYPPPPGVGTGYTLSFAAPGNPNLVPEQSFTVSGGLVYTPSWLEGLSLSLDWYSISIHGGIFAYSQGQIFDQCGNKKNPQFCSLVFFAKGWPGNNTTPVAQEIDGNGNPATGLAASLGTFKADSEGALNLYLRQPLNANAEQTSGMDFQIDYRHDLFAGALDWHFVGNYTDSKTRLSAGIFVNGAGAVSGDSAVNPLAGFTMPKFRGNMSATYTEDPWSVTAQLRLLGSARLSNQYLQGVSTAAVPTGYTNYVDDNSVPWIAYTDLRASWRWTDNIQLYGAVDNALNTPPPNLATTGGGGTDCRIYDCIGRSYRIGIRFND